MQNEMSFEGHADAVLVVLCCAALLIFDAVWTV
jgi:hypothetical protein